MRLARSVQLYDVRYEKIAERVRQRLKVPVVRSVSEVTGVVRAAKFPV